MCTYQHYLSVGFQFALAIPIPRGTWLQKHDLTNKLCIQLITSSRRKKTCWLTSNNFRVVATYLVPIGPCLSTDRAWRRNQTPTDHSRENFRHHTVSSLISLSRARGAQATPLLQCAVRSIYVHINLQPGPRTSADCMQVGSGSEDNMNRCSLFERSNFNCSEVKKTAWRAGYEHECTYVYRRGTYLGTTTEYLLRKGCPLENLSD